MPRKEDIEKFKEVLNSLGGEPEIMARRSQAIEDVQPPGEALPEPGGPGAPIEEPPSPLPEGAGEGAQDFGLDLSSLDDLDAGAQTGPPSAQPQTEGEQAPVPEESGLDFGSLFGDESAAPPIEDLEPSLGGPTGSAAEEPAEPGVDEFSLPESESAPLQSDLSQMEALPEDVGGLAGDLGELPSDLGTPPSDLGELPSDLGELPSDLGELPSDLGAVPAEVGEPLGDIGELPEPTQEGESLPGEPVSTEAPLEGLPSEEAMSTEAPSEDVLAGIELPNLEDLSLTEPLAGAEGEPLQAERAEAGLPEPGGEAEVPSLEDFDLGQVEQETPAGSAELPPSPAEEETPEQPAAGQPSETAGEEGLGDLNLEDFSFAEPSGQFAAEAQPEAEAAAPKPAPRPAPPRPAREAPAREAAREAAPLPELGAAGPEIALTPEQFNRLKRTLESLPRNLKMAVEGVIGQGAATGAVLTRLVSLLVQGAAAQEIATVVSRITGKRIVIPAGYEKKTGVAFEAEQRSFAYALRENIYPIVRLFAITVLAAALIGFLGYRLVYRPLYAIANYRLGYTHILGDRFTLANESFERARAAQRIKRWYYRYAEAFSDKRQYILAEQKYDLLLRDFPGDRKGILDYARMESTRLADFKKADDLLNILLDKDQYDFDALLAAGDNNLDWAGAEKDRADSPRYKAARVDYATLIEHYGTRDELLFRMLRWFIRTDNPQEIERLRVYFASRPELRVDPAVYAELGGYLVDHRQLDHAKDVLLKADEADSRLAEIHYNLARYYRLALQPDDELTALNATLLRLQPTDPLTPKRIAMEVDTHTRLGELYDQKGQYIEGEKQLTFAIARVEESQKSHLVATGGVFGRPYADLGDLHYYVIGDLDTARALYQKAIDNQYFDPSLDYKIGFTQYAAKDYQSALASFSKAEEEWGYPRDPDAPPPFVPSGTADVDYSGKPPVNLLFAIANCFYQRGDYFAAQGYYLRLRDRLEARRAAIGTLLPQEKPEHRSLLETLVKVDNNLGVVMARLAARTGDRTKRSEGLVYLADASMVADSLTRAPDSRSTGGARNLPFLNQRGILYPVSGFVPQISSDLPRDLGTLSW